MEYDSLLDKLLDEDNHDIIELQPEDGQVVRFEQIAVVNYRGTPYAIFHPMEMPEDQVVVFRLNPDEEDDLELEEDPEIGEAVLAIYHNDEEEEDEDE